MITLSVLLHQSSQFLIDAADFGFPPFCQLLRRRLDFEFLEEGKERRNQLSSCNLQCSSTGCCPPPYSPFVLRCSTTLPGRAWWSSQYSPPRNFWLQGWRACSCCPAFAMTASRSHWVAPEHKPVLIRRMRLSKEPKPPKSLRLEDLLSWIITTSFYNDKDLFVVLS